MDGSGNIVSPNPFSFLATNQEGTLGKGDVPQAQGGNQGFLRNDKLSGQSVIAVVVVTDEEDCSVRNTEHLKLPGQLPPDSPYAKEDINLRCFNHKEFAYDVRELLLFPPTRSPRELSKHHPYNRLERTVDGRSHLDHLAGTSSFDYDLAGGSDLGPGFSGAPGRY